MLTHQLADWEKATREYGSASVESMKVSTRNVLRKIEKAGGKEGGDGTASPAKGAAKKRKAAAEDGDDAEVKPKTKGRKKAKKAAAELEGTYPQKSILSGAGILTIAVDGSAAGDENGVKDEGNGSD